MRDANIIYLALLALLIASIILRRNKGNYAQTFKMAAIWLIIIAMIFGAYIYANEFKDSKFYTALFPAKPVKGENGTLQFTRANDGHFHIQAKVNGETIEFLLDTGASDITLNLADAQRLGFYESELRFNKPYTTANGITYGAAVKLKNIEIGNFQTGAIDASVNKGELETSLLGMHFLDKLNGYQIKGNKLIFVP